MLFACDVTIFQYYVEMIHCDQNLNFGQSAGHDDTLVISNSGGKKIESFWGQPGLYSRLCFKMKQEGKGEISSVVCLFSMLKSLGYTPSTGHSGTQWRQEDLKFKAVRLN